MVTDLSIDFGGNMGTCNYTGEVNAQNGPHRRQGTAVGEDGYRCEGTFKDGSGWLGQAKGKAFNRSGALWYEGEWSGGSGTSLTNYIFKTNLFILKNSM